MDRQPPRNRWSAFFLLTIAIGVVTAAAAWLWMSLATPARVWSPAQAAEFGAAQEAVHAARSTPPSGDAAAELASTPELEQAQRRFDEIKGQLARAQQAREDWGRWGVAAGLALIVLGGIGFLATRSA